VQQPKSFQLQGGQSCIIISSRWKWSTITQKSVKPKLQSNIDCHVLWTTVYCRWVRKTIGCDICHLFVWVAGDRGPLADVTCCRWTRCSDRLACIVCSRLMNSASSPVASAANAARRWHRPTQILPLYQVATAVHYHVHCSPRRLRPPLCPLVRPVVKLGRQTVAQLLLSLAIPPDQYLTQNTITNDTDAHIPNQILNLKLWAWSLIEKSLA